MTQIIRAFVFWMSDNVVRLIGSILVLSPLLVALAIVYGHLIAWMLMTLGVPAGEGPEGPLGAGFLAGTIVICTLGAIGVALIWRLTNDD